MKIIYMTEYVIDKKGNQYKWYQPLMRHVELKKKYYIKIKKQQNLKG